MSDRLRNWKDRKRRSLAREIVDGAMGKNGVPLQKGGENSESKPNLTPEGNTVQDEDEVFYLKLERMPEGMSYTDNNLPTGLYWDESNGCIVAQETALNTPDQCWISNFSRRVKTYAQMQAEVAEKLPPPEKHVSENFCLALVDKILEKKK